MAVYLIGFALSIGLIAFCEKKQRLVVLGISAIALLIPCLIAGLRAQTIGTDVMVYVKPLTEAAIGADNLSDFLNTYWFYSWRNVYVKDYEIGFSLLVYCIASVTKNLGAVLFAIQALTIVPIYLALIRNRQRFPVWLGMLIYYFMFFNSTLNMMRQWMAMAFLLLAMQMLLEKRGWLVVIFSLIGFIFHYSAILAVPVYLVYWFVWLPRNTQLSHNRLQIHGSTVVVVLFCAIGMLALLNLQLILKLLTSLGLDRFSSYLRGEPMQIMFGQIILRLPLLAVLLLNWKSLLQKTNAAPFYMAMLLLDMIAAQLVSVDENAIRIGYYFSVYSILWLPEACSAETKGAKRILCILFISVYAIAYWYYMFIFTQRHQTYPYAFAPYFQ